MGTPELAESSELQCVDQIPLPEYRYVLKLFYTSVFFAISADNHTSIFTGKFGVMCNSAIYMS